jgi:hypothetical protein
MKRNLVIGSEGFIGKPFSKFLESKGEEVVHFDIKRSKKEDGRTFKFDFKKFDKVYFLAWDVGDGSLKYDPDARRVTWSLPDFSSILLPSQASFEIQLKPTSADAGQVVNLVNPVSIQANGKDSFNSSSSVLRSSQVISGKTGDVGTVVK